MRGMVLGLAIGDALGAPTESMLPSERRQRFGEVRDYLPSRYNGDRRGYPTDDSQLALWTLDQVNQDHGLDPARLLKRFASRRVFGMGATVREALRRFNAGVPWQECGVESAGNGALMRIATVLIPHIAHPSPALWADAALATFITHNDRAALASSLAFVDLLWELFRMQEAPRPDWWAERFLRAFREIEPRCECSPRVPGRTTQRRPFWQWVEEWLRDANNEDLSVEQACDRWYSGAYLLETVPSVLYILMRHGHDAEEAIVRAVNDTKDNDTTGAIVGAAVGALHGERALPHRWIEGLSGRTVESDDGRVWELLREGKAVCGY
jgi:ADP-ribosylglycohydrolase